MDEDRDSTIKAAPNQTKPGNVWMQVERLRDIADRLEKDAKVLGELLSPILSEDTLATPSDGEDRPGFPPLADNLYSLCDRLDRVHLLLGMLSDRIDL